MSPKIVIVIARGIFANAWSGFIWGLGYSAYEAAKNWIVKKVKRDG